MVAYNNDTGINNLYFKLLLILLVTRFLKIKLIFIQFNLVALKITREPYFGKALITHVWSMIILGDDA